MRDGMQIYAKHYTTWFRLDYIESMEDSADIYTHMVIYYISAESSTGGGGGRTHVYDCRHLILVVQGQ